MTTGELIREKREQKGFLLRDISTQIGVDTVESFAESVKIVIYCLDDMRKLLVRRHKEINDFKIKLLEEQNA